MLPPPLSSVCVRLLERLCPAELRPCCTTGSSGGSSGCLETCSHNKRSRSFRSQAHSSPLRLSVSRWARIAAIQAGPGPSQRSTHI
jgi:hypothetical protein